MNDSLRRRQGQAEARKPSFSALRLHAISRQACRYFLLVSLVLVVVYSGDNQTARAFIISPRQAIETACLLSPTQDSDSQNALDRVGLLLNEIRASSYSELRGADIQGQLFESRSDYFRARFAIPPFLIGRKMHYIVFVNASAFSRQAPAEGVRAILAHELAHVLYFRQRNRLRLFGLVRLTAKGFTARFERWADLQAIARGYGEGLKAYRRWLYQNIPAQSVSEKRRNYFSPEEIDAVVSAIQNRPKLLAYWLKHVPRNLNEIQAGRDRTE